jgi:hypothetical protein
MPRKSETIEQRMQRLTVTVQQLEEENADLRERVRIFTPTEWKAKDRAREMERLRKETNGRRAEEGVSWSQDNHFPALVGSQKQIQWAYSIRRQLVELFRKEQPSVAAQVEEVSLREKIESIWWIARVPHFGRETATALLSRDAIHDNFWSGERTILPGVVIPNAAVSDDADQDVAADPDAAPETQSWIN